MIRVTQFIDTSGGLETTGQQLAKREGEKITPLVRTQVLHLLAVLSGLEVKPDGVAR